MAFWNNNNKGSGKEDVQVTPGASKPVATSASPTRRVDSGSPVSSGPLVTEGANTVNRSAITASPLDISSEDSLNERFGKLRSALSEGTVIQGKLSFDTPVRIDGTLSGEVYSSRAVIVGKNGVLDAKIEVQTLVVMGTVRGKIKVEDRIEVLAGGCIEGEIQARVLVVDEGATLNGAVGMNEESIVASSQISAAKNEANVKTTPAPEPKVPAANDVQASSPTVRTEAVATSEARVH